MEIELISLVGIDPEFEERTPHDLNSLTNKTFHIKFDKLKVAQEFKHVWQNSEELLEDILLNKKNKKGFEQAKKNALDNMFENYEEKIKNEQEQVRKVKNKSKR